MLKLNSKNYVDTDSECKYHMADSSTERFRMHSHDYYEIFLTGKNACYHLINGKKEILPPDTLVFIRPRDEHTYSVYKKPFIFDNLTFSERILSTLLDFLENDFSTGELLSSAMPPRRILSSVDAEKLRKKFNALNCIDPADIKQKRILLKSILFSVLMNHFSRSPLPENNRLPLWLEELCSLMEKPGNFCMGNERLFELSKKSEKHVCKSFRKYLNISVSEYITALRLNFAANLLLNSNLSVTDICFQCGFNNLSWFYKKFEAKFGVPPRQFRLTNSRIPEHR